MSTDEENEAFLQAIIEAPDEDAPRLVYADWLDDQGQADRADLIRLQIELAGRPGDRAIGERVEQLLARHRKEWEQELGTPATDCELRRGFVERATLSLRALLDLADVPLRMRTPLRELRVEMDGSPLPQAVVALVTAEVAHEHAILPLGLRGERLLLAVARPRDESATGQLRALLNRPIELVPATEPYRVHHALTEHYGYPRAVCPECGVRAGAAIIYGLVGGGAIFERARNGEVVLGGCMVGSANWACQACGHRW